MQLIVSFGNEISIGNKWKEPLQRSHFINQTLDL